MQVLSLDARSVLHTHPPELKVVTPTNVRQWIKVISKVLRTENDSLHFQEVMSGSSRLTLVAALSSLCVSCPFDYRYESDLKQHHHKDLADLIDKEFAPMTSRYSAKCTPWSTQSNR